VDPTRGAERFRAEATMKARPDDAQTIHERMAQIRRKHHEDVREVLAGAETVADWGRHIRLYSWAALGAAVVALIWTATNRGRTASMKTASPPNTDIVGAQIVETEAVHPEPSSKRTGLVAEVARFLTSVAVRAAQNYAACCLEEWIAPRRVVGATKPVIPPTTDDSPRPTGRARRPERHDGGCDKHQPILVSGGSRDD